MVNDAAVLDHIAKLPHARANFKQLVRELGARGEERKRLEEALDRLKQQGEVIETRSGHFVASRFSREFAVGRLNAHRDGYAFLIADKPIDNIKGDIYIPKESALQAMPGDRAVVRIVRVQSGGRADGEIVKILRRAHTTVVGEFRVRGRGNFVVPHDGRIQQWIEIPDGMEIPSTEQVDRVGARAMEVSSLEDLDGLIVNVELLEYSGDGGHPVGRVVEILGHPDDFGIDV
ncbi:MAG: hypothetical protein ACRD9L_14375 [Bryobacteraceae bacterium]